MFCFASIAFGLALWRLHGVFLTSLIERNVPGSRAESMRAYSSPATFVAPFSLSFFLAASVAAAVAAGTTALPCLPLRLAAVADKMRLVS